MREALQVTRQETLEKARAETRRVLACLRDLVEDSDLDRCEIEKRAGLSKGSLGRILGGRVRLRLSHLAAILAGLDASWESFFGEVFPLWPPRRGRRGRPPPPVNRENVSVYSCGVESIHELRLRIARCEQLLGELKKHPPRSPQEDG